MAPSSFKSSLTITHITTACAIIDIGGVKLLTDPVFAPAGTEWDRGYIVLKNSESPALELKDLPPIDGVLLSHEDHPDNLDELGRQLLDGRHVLTTMDGAKNLAPRPGVKGLQPWETTTFVVGGKTFQVTATPCDHVPGNECIGFILTADDFGTGANGLPNAIYFSGDTVYMEEFKKIPSEFNVLAAILNLGAASAPFSTGPVQITMDGRQAAQLLRELDAEVLIPMHYEWWGHFTEGGEELKKIFQEEGIAEKICWLTPGQSKKVF
ncbi:putative Zn-dependent hydrolases of the beta-lactamase protein [Xylogone sp. PMI_703]|nr:putative Zn-dependent hydrolases of the beta-lactamase protein [Xylogone sp. PMI_703]